MSSSEWFIPDLIRLAIISLQQVYNVGQLISPEANVTMRRLHYCNTAIVTVDFIYTLGSHEPAYFGWQFFSIFNSLLTVMIAATAFYLTFIVLKAYYSSVNLSKRLPSYIEWNCKIFATATILSQSIVTIYVLFEKSIRVNGFRHLINVGAITAMCYILVSSFLRLRGAIDRSYGYNKFSSGQEDEVSVSTKGNGGAQQMEMSATKQNSNALNPMRVTITTSNDVAPGSRNIMSKADECSEMRLQVDTDSEQKNPSLDSALIENQSQSSKNITMKSPRSPVTSKDQKSQPSLQRSNSFRNNKASKKARRNAARIRRKLGFLSIAIPIVGFIAALASLMLFLSNFTTGGDLARGTDDEARDIMQEFQCMYQDAADDLLVTLVLNKKESHTF
eukprot:jgi/Bigna1/76940/fgenesh1_pg.44_\